MRISLEWRIGLVLQLLFAPALHAQFVRPTLRASNNPIVARVDSLTALGDTTQALAILEDAVTPRSKDAAVWHRYGVLLWQRVAAQRRGGYIGNATVIRTLQLADSALRLATQFAPDSAAYWVTLAQFNLQSDVATMRFAASQQMASAQDAAKRVGDSAWLALAADELGLAAWRRRETTANRALVGAGQHVQLQTDGRFPRSRAKAYLESFAKKIQPPTGQADFESALVQFRLASNVAPSQLTYSRHVYMVLATGKRWEELLSLANQRAAASSFDAQAQFARGLALHRLGKSSAARAAFDVARSMIDEAEYAQLFRLDRLLPTTANVLTGERGLDAQAWLDMPVAERNAMTELYWALNDPESVTAANEFELEFMARVLQAEWSWTNEMLGLRGADTDRGDIFIRYGPPDDEMTIPGSASVQQDYSQSGDLKEDYWTPGAKGTSGGMGSSSQAGGAALAWIYKTGDVFFFDLAPGFGTARTPLTDQKFVAEFASVMPAMWNNLGVPVRVDSLPLRTTRFRAVKDSVDVVLVTKVPVAALEGDTPRESTTPDDIRIDLRIVDGGAHVFGRDSVRPSGLSTGSEQVSWVRRVGRGANFVRVEAVKTSTNRKANALRPISVDGASGFGISDILLAQVTSRPPQASPNRWQGLGVTPSAGMYRVGEKVGLAWEVYALGDSANSNRYRVTIDVERVARRGAAGLFVRVLDGVGSLLTQGRGDKDKLSIAFDRSMPTKDTQVEYLTLDGLGASAGDFTLRLTVTDLITKLTATRTTTLSIR